MDARTHTPANGWMRLDTLPSSLTSPSSKRWLVDDLNSTTRNSAALQSLGSWGSRSASGQVTVDTSVANVAFCGVACATQVNASHAASAAPIRRTAMLVPRCGTTILGHGNALRDPVRRAGG